MKATKTLLAKCYGRDFKGLEMIASSEDYLTQEYIYNRYNNIEDSFFSSTNGMNESNKDLVFDYFRANCPKAHKIFMEQITVRLYDRKQ